VPTVNTILMKYRSNNYSVNFIRERSFHRSKKLGNPNIVKALTSKRLLREWAHHSLLRRCQLIKDLFSIKVSISTLRKFYLEHRISYTGMRKTLSSRQSSQLVFAERLHFIDKCTQFYTEGREIMYFDEASTHLWETRTSIWQPKDDNIRVAIPSSRGSSVTMMGTISNKD
jgi:hypothetical protein